MSLDSYFEIGDIVKIRSLDWFEDSKSPMTNSVGKFNASMTEYCGKTASVINILSDKSLPESSVYLLDFGDNNNISNMWGWKDYMFSNIKLSKLDIGTRLLKYCTKYCKGCDPECYIHDFVLNIDSYVNTELLRVNDKVRIRSSDWFFFSRHIDNFVGIFTDEMSKYCGKEAIVTRVIESYGYKGKGEYRYKLDIDGEGFYWKDYMFELDFIDNIIKRKLRSLCNNHCVYECMESKCPLWIVNKNK